MKTCKKHGIAKWSCMVCKKVYCAECDRSHNEKCSNIFMFWLASIK